MTTQDTLQQETLPNDMSAEDMDIQKVGADEATDEPPAQQEGAGKNPARVTRNALPDGRAKDAQLCRPGIPPSREGLLAVADGNTAAIDSAEFANAPPLRYRVKLTQTSEVYDCMPEESMLQGMARLGRRGIPLGCLNGGCGICKVAVVSGEWQKTGLMSRAHVSEEEEARGVVLACRAAPGSDVEIEVLGKMQKSVFKGWGPP